MALRIVSDLKYQLVLLPQLDPPMTQKIKRKFREITRAELAEHSVSIESSTFNDDYHVFAVSAPPGMSPIAIAQVIQETSSCRLIAFFRELEGWGGVYHDRVMIKSGSRPGKDRIREFIDLSFSGI